jgi:hypothetical protein
MTNFIGTVMITAGIILYVTDFLGLITNLLVFLVSAESGKKTLLRVEPLGEESDAGNWLIQFSVKNFTEHDISIAPIVTATFKTGTRDSDIAFIISNPNTSIPANDKNIFLASARNQDTKPALPYSLHQIHVTVL